jgi:hypothetical protein
MLQNALSSGAIFGLLYDVAISCYLERSNIDWDVNAVVIVMEKYHPETI